MKKYLIIVLLTASISISYSCSSTGSENQSANIGVQEAAITKNVSVEEFKKLIGEKDNAILLDVRTQGEVDKGYLANSAHIDFYAEDFKDQLAKLDKSKPILIYCHSGRRSAIAMSSMRQMGFKEVYNLEPGILGWNAAGLPTEK